MPKDKMEGYLMRCVHCARPVEGKRADKSYYAHPQCAKEYNYCVGCNNQNFVTDKKEYQDIIIDGMKIEVCSTCLIKRYPQCIGTCGKRFYYDAMVRLENGRACQECALECPKCGKYKLPQQYNRPERDGYKLCDHCYMRKYIIRSHNFNPMEELDFIGKPMDKLFFGVELEVEVTRGANVDQAERICDMMRDFAICKHDGSLVNGFEVVTAPSTLEHHRLGWASFFKPTDGKGRLRIVSWNSPRCGMHVHMSREAIPPLHLARMFAFMHSDNNRKLISAVAGRDLSGAWADRYYNIQQTRKITDVAAFETREPIEGPNGDRYVPDGKGGFMELGKAILNGWKPGKQLIKRPVYVGDKIGPGSRYTALNDANPHTVEVRIFRGTLYRPSFFKNLEFCHAMWAFTKPGAQSLRSLENPEHFALFVEKWQADYRNLYRFFVKRNILTTSKRSSVH